MGVHRSSKKHKSNSTHKYTDASYAYNEEVTIYFDQETRYNTILLSKVPKGDIVSFIIHKDNEDIPIDGKMNIRGKYVDFLKEMEIYSGCKVTVVYITE